MSENNLVISPRRGWVNIGIKELWRYREVIYFFVWRDIKVRYKQTLIGVLWALFQPLVAMLIFTVFFGRFARIPSADMPYPVFVYTGLVLWNYFSFVLTHASESMVSNSGIIQKIYFPRLAIPLSSCFIGMVDFAISFILLFGMMIYYRFLPSIEIIIYLPLLIGITMLASAGLGCFFAALNVKYRDVRYAVPFLIQMSLFLTPVIYPLSMLSEKYRWVLLLNPMSGVIETSRVLISGKGPIDWPALSISILVSILLFAWGVAYFRKTEDYFADII
ncbi:MAG: ABC transporter permease [Candidatus Omnitrophica bacterium]|jgi:lipopolysaccharide transport system permease protein|nr:ABC transporter permease [Candidatus Omnitrophota bacterium]MDD5512253.1 ABC transporter permease [Candidatus Omnitrophota bacterium]